MSLKQDIKMKPGKTILIIPSIALSEMRLDDLVGRSATIVEVCMKNDIIRGCWVDIHSAYLGETEWYIPYNSIGA